MSKVSIKATVIAFVDLTQLIGAHYHTKKGELKFIQVKDYNRARVKTTVVITGKFTPGECKLDESAMKKYVSINCINRAIEHATGRARFEATRIAKEKTVKQGMSTISTHFLSEDLDTDLPVIRTETEVGGNYDFTTTTEEVSEHVESHRIQRMLMNVGAEKFNIEFIYSDFSTEVLGPETI